jgi:hypothetical protein
MLIPIAGTTHLADAQGKAVKRVICERCHCEYSYEMQRNAQVAGFNPYSPAPGMGERVEHQAKQAVQRRLAQESELIPCPKCGWFQTDMVEDARRRMHGGLRRLSKWIGIPGLVLMVLLAIPMMTTGDRDMLQFIGWGTTISLLFMPGLLLVRNWLAQGFEPNQISAVRQRLDE